MKTITLTACNRPEYLGRLLISLGRNSPDLLKQYHLHIRVDPTDKLDDVLIVLNRYRHALGLNGSSLTINEKRLGVRDNPYWILHDVFETMQSEWNIYLEDDIVISPDALALAEWSRQHMDLRTVCLNLCNYDSIPQLPDLVLRGYSDYWRPQTVYGCFNALGLAFGPKQWREFFLPRWHEDRRGWDWSVASVFLRERVTCLMPAWSRSTHVGQFGTHQSPQEFERFWPKHAWNASENVNTFRLLE